MWMICTHYVSRVESSTELLVHVLDYIAEARVRHEISAFLLGCVGKLFFLIFQKTKNLVLKTLQLNLKGKKVDFFFFF